MPPLVVAAGVTAAGAAVGAGINAIGQSKATNAQAKATADALAFQKDIEARRRQDYDRQQNLLQTRYDAMNNRRRQMLIGLGMLDPGAVQAVTPMSSKATSMGTAPAPVAPVQSAPAPGPVAPGPAAPPPNDWQNPSGPVGAAQMETPATLGSIADPRKRSPMTLGDIARRPYGVL